MMTHREYHQVYNEGGEGYNPIAEAADERTRQALVEGIRRRRAEWTREVTEARRAAWNAKVRAGIVTTAPGSIAAAEDAQGWTLSHLRLAIQEHGL